MVFKSCDFAKIFNQILEKYLEVYFLVKCVLIAQNCVFYSFSVLALRTLNILIHTAVHKFTTISAKVTLAREISRTERSDGHGGERQITLL